MAEQTLRVEYVSADDPVPNPQNPRLHSKKQIKQLKRSIQEFGFNSPLLVDERMHVIAGHARLSAAKLLGQTHVPVIRLEHLSELQKRAFMLADNKLAENSVWDQQLVGEHLKILTDAEINFDLELTGFEMAEIDMAIDDLMPTANHGSDSADVGPETACSPVTQPGDLWCLGKNRVYCGDSTTASSYEFMNGARANVVFTDPPYNVPIDGYVSGFGKQHHREFAMASGELTAAEFERWLAKVLSHLATNSIDGALQFICMDWRHSGELLAAARETYTEFKNLCVWVKETAGQGSLYRSQHELIFVFKSGNKPHRNNIQLGKFGRYRTNVWNYKRVNTVGGSGEDKELTAIHPTIKPVQLVVDAILDCTARGDSVLDAFLGTGTTLVASERTGRRCYGIELDPGYVDTSIRRWEKFTGSQAVHQQTGRTFRACEEKTVDVSNPCSQREDEVINATN
jgi:DNA modification methylase